MKKIILFLLLILSPNVYAGNTFSFDNGNSFWIDGATGNIGIGTTNGLEKLHVQNGNIKVINGGFIGDGSQLTNLPATASLAPTVNDNVSRSFVSSTSAPGFQISSAKYTEACYSVQIDCSTTIGGPCVGAISLEKAATNSSTPSDWKVASKTTSGQTATLAVALALTQNAGVTLCDHVTAGWYRRLRTTTTSGTPTYTYVNGEEMISA